VAVERHHDRDLTIGCRTIWIDAVQTQRALRRRAPTGETEWRMIHRAILGLLLSAYREKFPVGRSFLIRGRQLSINTTYDCFVRQKH
jgi:hypothetical protein